MRSFLQLMLRSVLLLLIHTGAQAQGVGIGTNAADTSALLDLTSNSKGLLIPRVDLASGNVKLPATALMVFNTNAAYGTGTGIYINQGTAAIPSWQQLVPANSGNFVRNQATVQYNSGFNVSGNGTVNGSMFIGNGLSASYTSVRTTAMDALQLASSDPMQASIYFHNTTVPGRWRLNHAGSANSAYNNFTLTNTQNVPVITATQSGFVGINNLPQPSEALDVNGNIRATGQFIVDLQYISREVNIGANVRASYFMECPAGKKMVSGGGGHRDFNSAMNDIEMKYSGPDPSANGSRWRFFVRNSGNSSRVLLLYCTCAKVQ